MGQTYGNDLKISLLFSLFFTPLSPSRQLDEKKRESLAKFKSGAASSMVLRVPGQMELKIKDATTAGPLEHPQKNVLSLAVACWDFCFIPTKVFVCHLERGTRRARNELRHKVHAVPKISAAKKGPTVGLSDV